MRNISAVNQIVWGGSRKCQVVGLFKTQLNKGHLITSHSPYLEQSVAKYPSTVLANFTAYCLSDASTQKECTPIFMGSEVTLYNLRLLHEPLDIEL